MNNEDRADLTEAIAEGVKRAYVANVQKGYQHREACVQFVADAAAFLRFAVGHNIPESEIVITLAHDIGGLSRRERCFLPRVDGYAAKEKEAANE
jgi:hypothetical protein